MKISLPSRRNGKSETLGLSPGQCLIIVGANGAGKTRFTAATAESLGAKAYTLSALHAIYKRISSVDSLSPQMQTIFSQAVTAHLAKNEPATPLELLLGQLMHDELLNLIGYKLAVADHKDSRLQKTRLDSVIEIWQDIFSGNRVLIDSGKLLFTRGVDLTTHTALRLSDGEKAVLYYAAAVLYAEPGSVIFVESPEIFLHPSITSSLWNRLENLRNDCVFCYTTHDTEFVATRNGATMVWVRDCDPAKAAWDYDIIPPSSGISNELYLTLAGSRKPVLFIEGDSERSIDARLYPLIFPDFTIRSLGSCNKVIEATRTFNDLNAMHKLDSYGIVDRDRRDEHEVGYLRGKKIMVPDVAEVENLLLLEEVVRAMAVTTGNNPDRVFSKVRKAVIAMFNADIRQQALLHTRHRVKRTVEYRVDARFSDITTLERHLDGMLAQIEPRKIYENFCAEFRRYATGGDYRAVLKVYNQKAMLPGCNVAQMCGFGSKNEYIAGVMRLLRARTPEAETAREALRNALGAYDVIGAADSIKPVGSAPKNQK